MSTLVIPKMQNKVSTLADKGLQHMPALHAVVVKSNATAKNPVRLVNGITHASRVSTLSHNRRIGKNE